MLRRDRLRLVVAAVALLLAACGPRALQNTDNEPVAGDQIRAGRALLNSGDVDGALEFWDGLVQEHPGSWEAHRGLQDTLRARLPGQEFEARYRAARDRAPGEGLAWYLWGRARIDHDAEAFEAFSRAVELAPMSPWPPAALAYLRWRAGDLFLTVETYEEAIERLPGSATLRLLLGNQLITLRLTIAAQRHLEIARRLDPENPDILAALGKTYVQLDRPQAGGLLLEQALERNPRMGDVCIALAQVYLFDRRIDEAEGMYRRALELGIDRDDELYGAIRAAKLVESNR